MAYAILVGEKMAETTILSDSEYETLKNVLRLARSDDGEERAIAGALSSCDAEMCKSHGDASGIF